MTDHKTIEVYNARAADYAKLFSAEDKPKSSLQAFLTRLAPGSRILDMGCGPGTDAAHMAAAGHHPDPVDPSEAMIEIARSRHNLPARLGTFYDLEGPYHGIWASFSLLHMPRAEVPDYFRLLHGASHPGALLHLGLKTGVGEARDGIGRQYSYFTADEITDWLAAAGFTAETPKHGEEAGLAGNVEPFFTLTAKRNAD